MADTSAVILAFLLDWLAKGFLILGLAFAADLMMRRANPSLRHRIWLAGLAAGILLPVLTSLVPSFNTPLFRLNFLSADPATGPDAAAAASRSGPAWTAPGILLGTYVVCAALVFAWQVVGRAYALRLRRSALRITDPRAVGELRRLKAALGIHVAVDLLASDLISIPFSTGYWRPAIVLPRATSSWPPTVFRSVLVHELAHIKRKDVLIRAVAQVGCCIHWINPLAWYGFGRIVMEQEIACDHQVLGNGTNPSEYARNLLALAEARRGRLDFAVTSLGRRVELKSRLLEILKPTRSRMPVRIGVTALFPVMAMALILPVSALQIWDSSRRPAPASTTRVQTGPAPAMQSQSPATPPAMPDIEMVKKKISMKLQDMKAQGASEEELKRFASEAKAKLATLQNAARTPDVKVVKKKQEEKDSPIVLQKLQVAKGAK